MTPTDIAMDMLRCSDEGDFAGFRARLDPACEWVNPVVHATGADDIATGVADFFAAFPRRRHDVSLVLGSGDTVAIEGEWLATHESGRGVRAPFAAIIRVCAGRVAAVRLYLDTAALMAQLPTPSPA
jgi:ketosteroid isomerase-like protein